MRRDIPACVVNVQGLRACDALLVELNIGRSRLSVIAIYRSPTVTVSNPLTFVEEDLGTLLGRIRPESDCLLLGDINICIAEPDDLSSEYLDTLSAKGFSIMNGSTPTRVTSDSSSVIDHVFGRLRHPQGYDIRVCDPRGVSDHQLINLSLFGNSLGREEKYGRPIRSIDYQKVHKHALEADWSELYCKADPDHQAELLMTACQRALDYGTTLKRTKPRFRPLKEWMSPRMVKAIRKRNRLYRQYRRHGSMESRLLYESFNKWLRRALRRVKLLPYKT